MDWAANLLGLDRIFTNASGIGGGVIQVSTMLHNNHYFPNNLKNLQDDCFGFSSNSCGCRPLTIPEESPRSRHGRPCSLYDYTNTLPWC